MFSDILTPKRWWRKLYGVHMKDFPEAKIVSTDSLIPYAMNSRTHSDKQIDQIAASIKEFGFLNPVIIDAENGIIAGHGRVMAAKKLGMTELPVMEAKHLTESQRKAYVIADNRLALNSGWDEELLKIELSNLEELDFDISILGFDHSEINFSEMDYSALDGEDVDSQLEQMAKGVRKAIQIEFEPEHYEDAAEIIKFWRDRDAYVGYMILQYLEGEKEKL